jgi:hypothetical protein
MYRDRVVEFGLFALFAVAIATMAAAKVLF